MNKMPKSIQCLFFILFALAILNSCSWFGRGTPEETKGPEQLIKEGMEYWEKGYYENATEAFQKIKDRYPYSKYAVIAELRMADALYKRDLYSEAYEAYKEFEKLHPKNPEIPYVIYQQGMCHYKQVGSIDRDQSHTLIARQEFERLIKRYPKSRAAGQARRKLRECYIKLAQHELYVGKFYFKSKRYYAAKGRFLYILEHYPDLGQYHEAIWYLSKCEAKLAELAQRENKNKEKKKN